MATYTDRTKFFLDAFDYKKLIRSKDTVCIMRVNIEPYNLPSSIYKYILDLMDQDRREWGIQTECLKTLQIAAAYDPSTDFVVFNVYLDMNIELITEFNLRFQ